MLQDKPDDGQEKTALRSLAVSAAAFCFFGDNSGVKVG
jgi:hypothetical protein